VSGDVALQKTHREPDEQVLLLPRDSA